MNIAEKIVVLFCMAGIGFVFFEAGKDAQKEKICGKFNGVYVDGHCLKPDTLMFQRGH
jgi:hypothetical protein